MSDSIKHECGIAMLRLLKPLEYYKQKYGTALYGIQKMYLLLEKQHNRGQDGAGYVSVKLNAQPGQKYIDRVRSNDSQPIKDVFAQINKSIEQVFDNNPQAQTDTQLLKDKAPFVGELMLGHVRYGTYGKNNIENVHPFIRNNNWMHRNLIVAGNFNLTNVSELFANLVELGQHPMRMADTITVMEKIGHFLDDEVSDLYLECKQKGLSKKEASQYIADHLDIARILTRASKNWDGGYVMAGLLGHGDAFVLRDPNGIRPAFYYQDEEIAVVASERPVIQTVFNVPLEQVHELQPGNALIVKKNGTVTSQNILPHTQTQACSFERIYFSRGSDADIYQERKELGRQLMPMVMQAIQNDLQNTVFSYIPNTAETSFYGMIETAQQYLDNNRIQTLLQHNNPSPQDLENIFKTKIRTEKIALKDVKLRTFITEDSSRDDLVAHVYDVTYGVVKPTDNLVIIDDSIVRGTTLKQSIIRMLTRLQPKKIIIVSSAPQIRYPDCYGIDMANLGGLIAFQAALQLLKENGKEQILHTVYQQATTLSQTDNNYVKAIYEPFTDQQISQKISQLVASQTHIPVEIIFQTVQNLHQACPKHTGDWYFTGNYPTPGGNRVANQAFINFYEGNNNRAY